MATKSCGPDSRGKNSQWEQRLQSAWCTCHGGEPAAACSVSRRGDREQAGHNAYFLHEKRLIFWGKIRNILINTYLNFLPRFSKIFISKTDFKILKLLTFLQNNFECFVTEISINFQSECDFFWNILSLISSFTNLKEHNLSHPYIYMLFSSDKKL